MATHSFLQEVAREYSIDNLESDVLKVFTREQLEKLDPAFSFYVVSTICAPADLFAYAVSSFGMDANSETVISFLEGIELGVQLYNKNLSFSGVGSELGVLLYNNNLSFSRLKNKSCL